MQNNRMGGIIAIGLVLLVLVGVGAYFLGRSSLDAAGALNAPASQTPAAAPAEAESPQWTTSATHENWLLRCRTDMPEQGANACVGVLELVNEDTNQLVLAWLVAPGADGVLNSTFQTPLGVQVGAGIDIQFDEGAVRKVGFASCGTQFCLASATMDEAFTAEAVAAARAQIVIHTPDNQAVNLGVPLAGLAAVIQTFQ